MLYSIYNITGGNTYTIDFAQLSFLSHIFFKKQCFSTRYPCKLDRTRPSHLKLHITYTFSHTTNFIKAVLFRINF